MPRTQIAPNNVGSGVIEIFPRLFYAALRNHPSTSASRKSSDDHVVYFTIDNEFVYWNFFLDFGPFNLGQLYRFCTLMNSKLGGGKTPEDILYSATHSVCFYSGTHPHCRANAIFLICAWQILFLRITPEESFEPFKNAIIKGDIDPLPTFHDASPGVCTYTLTLMDVLRGLYKARAYNFFSSFTSDDPAERFDVEEYEHYEMVEHGDLNWIIKDRFLAFAGPSANKVVTHDGYVTLAPKDYIPYFQRKNVGLVVRLNKRLYDERYFTMAGIGHSDHYYLDGSVPPMKILQKVVSAMENCILWGSHGKYRGRGVAVHCKAGLGRTGTCIGAYIMKHYKFSAAECIGWMRLCRPGMVIGPQQQYLQKIEQRMWYEGDVMRQTVPRNMNRSDPPRQSRSPTGHKEKKIKSHRDSHPDDSDTTTTYHSSSSSSGMEEHSSPTSPETSNREFSRCLLPSRKNKIEGKYSSTSVGVTNSFCSMSIDNALQDADMDTSQLDNFGTHGRPGQAESLLLARHQHRH